MSAIYSIPIIANGLTDTAGQPLSQGQLVITATNELDQEISYQPSGFGHAITGSAKFPIRNGTVAGFSLPDPAHTNPLNIRYRFTVVGPGGRSMAYPGIIISRNAPDGVSFDFGYWVPSNVSSLPMQSMVVGPTGPAGPQGPAAAPTVSYFVSSAVSAYTAVVSVNGQVVTASNANAAHLGRVIGLATNSATNGQSVAIQYTGAISYNGWNWPDTRPVFVDANGALTQTPPTSPAVFSQVIGIPINSTTVLVQIQPPIALA